MKNVVIVDDVCTSGQSIIKAVQAMRDLGCQVVGVLTLVDRLQGGRELLLENGIPYVWSLFTIDEFINHD